MVLFELLELLIADSESSGLMIVGCYRSEDVTETNILSKTISNLNDNAQSLTFTSKRENDDVKDC